MKSVDFSTARLLVRKGDEALDCELQEVVAGPVTTAGDYQFREIAFDAPGAAALRIGQTVHLIDGQTRQPLAGATVTKVSIAGGLWRITVTQTAAADAT